MTEPRPIVVVTSRHRPHELFLFALQVLLGVAYLVTVPAPRSLAALVPSWLVHVWAVGLTVSGVLGLAAAVWHRRASTALELERAALLLSTGALGLIGGASFVASGWAAIFGGSMILFWAAANLVRCNQIRKETADLSKAESEQQ